MRTITTAGGRRWRIVGAGLVLAGYVVGAAARNGPGEVVSLALVVAGLGAAAFL